MTIYYIFGSIAVLYLIAIMLVKWYDKTHPDDFPPMTGE